MSTPPLKSSSAERRVLWELRQRYKVNSPRSSGDSTPPPPRPPRLKPSGAPRPSRKPKRIKGRRHWLKRFVLFFIVLLMVGSSVFGYKILAASNKISVAERSLLGQLKDLLLNSGQFLDGEQDGRINILLIAVGGEGHKGENLADTIMVASIRPQDNAVAILSIPRDLYVQVPGEEYFTKINAVHSYGESQQKDHGPEALREKVAEITGLPIHYYGRIDFNGFKSIVDSVGGVNIAIENSFYDYWHKISFPAGTEKMNGERALAFVRARYIEGSEGGDFKRAARQQQVLLALRDKVFSIQTAVDFSAVNSILNSLSDNIRTDMQLWEMKRFYELARIIGHNQVKSVVLTAGSNDVLVGSTEVLGGVPASVLLPRVGDYSEIQAIARNIFDSEANITAATDSPQETPPPPEPEGETLPSKPTLEFRNGTNITGLAGRAAAGYQAEGYEIVNVGNANNRSVTSSIVYALRSDQTDTAKQIAEKLGAQSDSGLPANETASTADILIILGPDAE